MKRGGDAVTWSYASLATADIWRTKAMQAVGNSSNNNIAVDAAPDA